MNIASAGLRAAVAGALLNIVAAHAGDPRFDVVRRDGEVVRESGGDTELQASDTVSAGERVRTGADGHLALQLPPVGTLTLGADTALYVHSIEAEDLPARSALARLVLEQGIAHVTTRSQQRLPPADLRINVGELRLRVFGAEIWVARGADAEEVCLLAGAIELQSPAGARRLDEPGRCLRHTASGLQDQDARSTAQMAPRLNLTAFPGEAGQPWNKAAARPPAAAADTGFPAGTPAPDPLPVPVPTPDTAWTIVLASLPDADAAEQEAARLRGVGLAARVVESRRADGNPTYRVITGRYASKSEAAPDIQAIRTRRGLRNAWVAPLP
ncbi:SPOR domain-containing protein [Fontimonas sp. SYSU GA230001]|uniref:SPOR domain-containing protein n=1 Tax=Fontimonas sp. SYSU GA230001 TaxID=3142450 RepID=UPI0032B460A1